jgi:hypothetical protein
LRSPLSSWWGSAGAIFVADADGSWKEPRHLDGGASVLHIGFTLHGKRLLTMEQPGGENVLLENIPGSVYLGVLTGPQHFVEHQPCPTDQLLSDKFSFSIMVRTTLFPHTQSRQRNTTPHPVEFFKQLCASFTRALQTNRFVLPPLELCMSFFDVARKKSPGPPAKRVKKH